MAYNERNTGLGTIHIVVIKVVPMELQVALAWST